MSDSEGESVTDVSLKSILLNEIARADALLADLKKKVMDAQDKVDAAAAASAACDKLAESVSRMQDEALNDGACPSILIDSINMIPIDSNATHLISREAMWETVQTNLESIGAGSEDFRKKILWCQLRVYTDDEDGEEETKPSTLIHEICKRNPPLEVLKTFLDITPKKEIDEWSKTHLMMDEWSKMHFDRLARIDGDYPLHTAMRHGSSLEVAKLLVSDGECLQKETICSNTRSGKNVFHILAANKDSHHAKDFSAISRFLVQIVTDKEYKTASRSTLHHADKNLQVPVALLYKQLKSDGKSTADILRNEDFRFWLKATSYQKTCLHFDEQSFPDYQDIDKTRLLRAFLSCSNCFLKEDAEAMLSELIATDRNALFDKDSKGQYPIHHVIGDRCFGFLRPSNGSDVQHEGPYIKEMLKIMLDRAPEIAKLKDGDGLIPLHIVADRKNPTYRRDSERVNLARLLCEAWPESICIAEKHTRLLPFMLAVRGDPEEEQRRYYSEAISTSFYLLQQCPDLICNIGAKDETESASGSEHAERPAKRPCVSKQT